jgi:cobalamin biosynthesis protein CobT
VLTLRALVGPRLTLREGLLKKNIDGEALLWAYRHLPVRQSGERSGEASARGDPRFPGT